jgi:hypothetical protein
LQIARPADHAFGMCAAENLPALEEELKQAMMREEYLDAIDVFEEIEKKGLTQPRHLLGWGECLVKLRRKQDARQKWLAAYQMDSSFQPVIKQLDENFPGWKKTIPAPQPAAPARSPEPRPSAPAAQAARPTAGPSSSRPSPAAPQRASYSEAEINWSYVMEDVAELRAAAESRSLSDAAL